MSPESSIDSGAALIAAYTEVCRSYERIDDFRAKLLGLLPLASGTGLFFLLEKTDTGIRNDGRPELLVPAGIFGFVVTVGLLFYELRGIQRCIRLASVGSAFESLMEQEGRFKHWPHSLFRFINEPIAAAFIYAAVLAAWTFLALFSVSLSAAIIVAGIMLLGGFALIWRFYWYITREEEAWRRQNIDRWLAAQPSPGE